MIRLYRGGVPPFRTALLASAMFLSLPLSSVMAQTAMQPPGRNRATPEVQQQNAAPAVQRPVTEEMVTDAMNNAAGVYFGMTRTGIGGQIQKAWNNSDERTGVEKFRLCADCVYKIRTREFMSTSVLLPADAEIISADLGDNQGFQVKVIARNMLSVKPTTYGIDTNLNVYTRSGGVYPFYIRAESFNSVLVPDIVVRIVGEETQSEIKGTVSYLPAGSAPAVTATGQTQGNVGSGNTTALAGIAGTKATTKDFVEQAPANPADLHGWDDYKLWGSTEKFKPKVVARNKTATYLYYGDDWDKLELPTAYVVVDGIDEVVNTRIEGTTYIIEATADLISLKLGTEYMCIEYTGEKG